MWKRTFKFSALPKCWISVTASKGAYQHRGIKTVELFRGTIDGAESYPREVVKEALMRKVGAAGHGGGAETASWSN